MRSILERVLVPCHAGSAGGTVRPWGERGDPAVRGRRRRRRGRHGASTSAAPRSSSGSSSPEKVAALKAELAPHREATPLGRNDFEGFVTRRIYALFGKVRGFDELAIDPLMLGVLDHVLGPHYQLSGPVGHRPRAGGDAAGPAPGRRRLPAAVPAPAGGAQHDVGARRLHRGQRRHLHRARAATTLAGRAQARSTPRPSTATMPAGSVMFYVGSGVARGRRQPHRRAPARRDPRVRRVVAPGAGDAPAGGAARGGRARCRRRLQELLGYNIFPPFLGYVDGRHPIRTLGSRT